MNIVKFESGHIKEALEIAKANYEEERGYVPALPPADRLPDLSCFTGNGFGFSAFVDGEMLGFLCFYNPWDNVFTTNAKGSFSPIHGHGAVSEDREMIYRRLYQYAAEKLVQAGIGSHAVALYAHDTDVIKAFYTYGFGLRCVDAVRPMTEIECGGIGGYTMCELPPERKYELLPLKNQLIGHLLLSPSFMSYDKMTQGDLDREYGHRKPRYFCALCENEIVAFIETADYGENFACCDAKMKNICGAFCRPDCRGKGVYQNLLNYTITVLKGEGYTRLGVDFESFNPTAYGFWLKYFTAYTNSVVRRIDEKAVGAHSV